MRRTVWICALPSFLHRSPPGLLIPFSLSRTKVSILFHTAMDLKRVNVKIC